MGVNYLLISYYISILLCKYEFFQRHFKILRDMSNTYLNYFWKIYAIDSHDADDTYYVVDHLSIVN